VLIHRPHVILKDRPYLDRSLELDLGEIRIINEKRTDKGRYKSAPFKETFLNTLIIDAKDLGIRYSTDQFAVAEPFDMKVDFSLLSYSPFLPNIDSS
jgi:hypothetical protein